MDLLTGFYSDKDEGRTAELMETLSNNLRNDRIARVHLFVEDSSIDAPKMGKVVVINVGHRMTFADYFSYANENLVGKKVMLANSDVFFDDTLALLDDYELKGKMLCLSRWDKMGEEYVLEFVCGQDSWAFQPPIPRFPCDWPLGKLGSELRLNHEARKAGMTLLNPAFSIRSFHLHSSGVKNYSRLDGIMGEEDQVWASTLNPEPTRITMFPQDGSEPRMIPDSGV